LNVPTVLETKGTKLVIGQLAVLPTHKLVTVLCGPQFYKLAVKFCVLVHLDSGEKLRILPNKA
jgi:hypothetical protein